MVHKINQSYRLWVLLLVSMLLNGCATTQYGNFIQNASLADSQSMADDVAAQIIRLYPPATTQFNLRHASHDSFGQALIESLRQAGFAVREAIDETPFTLSQLSDAPSQSPQPEKGLTLSYVVDQSDDLYHTKLMIGDTRLSRAFVAKADGIHPAGLWVKRVEGVKKE